MPDEGVSAGKDSVMYNRWWLGKNTVSRGVLSVRFPTEPLRWHGGYLSRCGHELIFILTLASNKLWACSNRSCCCLWAWPQIICCFVASKYIEHEHTAAACYHERKTRFLWPQWCNSIIFYVSAILKYNNCHESSTSWPWNRAWETLPQCINL